MDPIIILGIVVVLLIGAYVWYKVDQGKRKREFETRLQQLPESERQAFMAQKQAKDQWGCLTAFLTLAVVGNLFFALMSFLSTSDSVAGAVGAIVSLIGAGLAAVALWKHKRWAVYGYGAMLILVVLLNLAVAGFAAALPGLLPLSLLYVAARPVWAQLQ